MRNFKFNVKGIALIVIGVAVNYLLFLICSTLNMPIWMDVTGTALVSIIGGVIPGVIVAAVNAVLLAAFHFGWSSLLYVFVSISIAVVFGLIAKTGKINSTLSVFGMILIGMFVKIISSTIIAVILAEAPANAYELICFNGFVDAGYPQGYALLLSTFVTNIPDAIGTAVITFGGYRVLHRIGFMKSKDGQK